jgi:hypothetical protein
VGGVVRLAAGDAGLKRVHSRGLLLMTVRNRRILCLTLLTAAVVLAGSTWLLWPRTTITRQNAARIETGMDLGEVEAILGGPERNESTGMLRRFPQPVEPYLQRYYLHFAGSPRFQAWITNFLVVEVNFDDDMRVMSTNFFNVQVFGEPSLFERIRRRIGV